MKATREPSSESGIGGTKERTHPTTHKATKGTVFSFTNTAIPLEVEAFIRELFRRGWSILIDMFERFRKPKSESALPAEKSKKDFDRYCKWLLLDTEQLAGKTILDVGSADSRFGEYVEQHYPDTKVLKLDMRSDDLESKVDFFAQADKLPLRAESVDLALAFASISNSAGEYVVRALKEIFSTVKDGGEIHISPIFDAPFEFSQERLRLVREYVRDLENQDVATATWTLTSTKERTLKGRRIKESEYCLIIKKQTVEVED